MGEPVVTNSLPPERPSTSIRVVTALAVVALGMGVGFTVVRNVTEPVSPGLADSSSCCDLLRESTTHG
jgi:hypothetical protein